MNPRKNLTGLSVSLIIHGQPRLESWRLEWLVSCQWQFTGGSGVRRQLIGRCNKLVCGDQIGENGSMEIVLGPKKKNSDNVRTLAINIRIISSDRVQLGVLCFGSKSKSESKEMNFLPCILN